ncbi:MAG: DUF4198 domain-containing protein [Synergistaceae bacterium]|jgi:uncharacterized GH25 family protein|nr:DUF4198 domain-containing protein [Synergistaceae bacterium]
MRRFVAVLVVMVLVVMLLVGMTSAVFAHELIVKPTKTEIAKGEVLPIELHSTHQFIVKEEVENVSLIEAGVFRDGKLEKVELKGNEPELRIDYNVKVVDDGAVLILANKDGEVWSITNEGSQAGTRKELEAKNLKVLRATKTDKFAKAIVNASKEDTNFATVVGQELEVIPVTNPVSAKVGEYFEVKVQYKGQPVALPVWASYDGFASDLVNTYAYYTESNAEGIAKIKITAPGFWFVRAAKDGEPGVEGEYDARNLRSILSFSVK